MGPDSGEVSEIKRILKEFPRGLTISDISQRIGLNRNSVAKYLEVLLASGQVEMRPYGPAKVYCLSHRMPISAMLSFTKDFILVLDENSKVVQINDNFLAFTGRKRDELIGMQITELELPIVKDPNILKALDGSGDEKEFVQLLPSEPGKAEAYYRVRIVPTVFEGGTSGKTLIMEDVTGEKKNEQLLRESESRYRAVVEDQTELICRFLPNFTITFVNQAYCEFFGKSPGELLGSNLQLFIPGEERTIFVNNIAQLSREHPVVTHEQRVSQAGGKILWQQWTERALINEAGDIYEYQAVGRDITVQKDLESNVNAYIRNMEFLCQTAMEFAEIPVDADINRYIGERIQALVPESIVGVLTHDEEDVLHLKYVSNPAIVQRIKEITGSDLFILPLRIGSETKQSLLDGGKLVRIPSSSGIFQFRDLPARELSSLLRQFGIGVIYLASLTWNKRLFGSVAIAVREHSQLGDQRVIETLITQAAITVQRKLANEALSESERRFRSITDLSPFPIAIIGEDGEYLYINKKFSEVFGYSSRDLQTGRDWFRLAFPDPVGRTEAIKQWKNDLQNSKVGDVRRRQFHVRCADGSIKEILFSPVTMPDTRQCVIYEDITIQKHSESVRSLLAAIVESTNDAIIGMDRGGSITIWNRAAEDVYGYSAAEIIGMPVSVLIPADGRSHWKELISRVMEGERITHFRSLNVRKGGQIIDVSISISPITDAMGIITGVSGIIRDVTQQIRKERERIIMESAIASSINAIGIADLEGNVTYVNEAFLRMWGYENRGEVIGKPIEIYAHEDGSALDDIKEVLSTLFRVGEWNGKVLARKNDGTTFYAHLSANMVRDDHGTPLCLMASFIDINVYADEREDRTSSE